MIIDNQIFNVARLYGELPHVLKERYEFHHGMCELCKENPSTQGDHDHKTGVFRGWLCRQCNIGLGMFKDNKRVLAQAIIYLEDAELDYVGELPREYLES